MNYIYDILLNYNAYIYDIFEWNKDDDIIHIRKIPLFKVDTKTLYDFIHNKVKIEDQFLNKIYKKTEIFNRNKINIDSCFLISDGQEVIAFKGNHQGYITEYSKLLIEEEIEVLEICEDINEIIINYEIIKEKKLEIFKTRNELKMRNYIFSEIEKMIIQNDNDKLQYLYLDCFNENRKSDEINEIIFKELDNRWEEVYYKIYSFLKKTTQKK